MGTYINKGNEGFRQECFIPNKEVSMEMVNAVTSITYDKDAKQHTCKIEKYNK